MSYHHPNFTQPLRSSWLTQHTKQPAPQPDSGPEPSQSPITAGLFATSSSAQDEHEDEIYTPSQSRTIAVNALNVDITNTINSQAPSVISPTNAASSARPGSRRNPKYWTQQSQQYYQQQLLYSNPSGTLSPTNTPHMPDNSSQGPSSPPKQVPLPSFSSSLSSLSQQQSTPQLATGSLPPQPQGMSPMASSILSFSPQSYKVLPQQYIQSSPNQFGVHGGFIPGSYSSQSHHPPQGNIFLSEGEVNEGNQSMGSGQQYLYQPPPPQVGSSTSQVGIGALLSSHALPSQNQPMGTVPPLPRTASSLSQHGAPSYQQNQSGQPLQNALFTPRVSRFRQYADQQSQSGDQSPTSMLQKQQLQYQQQMLLSPTARRHYYNITTHPFPNQSIPHTTGASRQSFLTSQQALYAVQPQIPLTTYQTDPSSLERINPTSFGRGILHQHSTQLQKLQNTSNNSTNSNSPFISHKNNADRKRQKEDLYNPVDYFEPFMESMFFHLLHTQTDIPHFLPLQASTQAQSKQQLFQLYSQYLIQKYHLYHKEATYISSRAIHLSTARYFQFSQQMPLMYYTNTIRFIAGALQTSLSSFTSFIEENQVVYHDFLQDVIEYVKQRYFNEIQKFCYHATRNSAPAAGNIATSPSAVNNLKSAYIAAPAYFTSSLSSGNLPSPKLQQSQSRHNAMRSGGVDHVIVVEPISMSLPTPRKLDGKEYLRTISAQSDLLISRLLSWCLSILSLQLNTLLMSPTHTFMWGRTLTNNASTNVDQMSYLQPQAKTTAFYQPQNNPMINSYQQYFNHIALHSQVSQSYSIQQEMQEIQNPAASPDIPAKAPPNCNKKTDPIPASSTQYTIAPISQTYQSPSFDFDNTENSVSHRKSASSRTKLTKQPSTHSNQSQASDTVDSDGLSHAFTRSNNAQPLLHQQQHKQQLITGISPYSQYWNYVANSFVSLQQRVITLRNNQLLGTSDSLNQVLAWGSADDMKYLFDNVFISDIVQLYNQYILTTENHQQSSNPQNDKKSFLNPNNPNYSQIFSAQPSSESITADSSAPEKPVFPLTRLFIGTYEDYQVQFLEYQQQYAQRQQQLQSQQQLSHGDDDNENDGMIELVGPSGRTNAQVNPKSRQSVGSSSSSTTQTDNTSSVMLSGSSSLMQPGGVDINAVRRRRAEREQQQFPIYDPLYIATNLQQQSAQNQLLAVFDECLQKEIDICHAQSKECDMAYQHELASQQTHNIGRAKNDTDSLSSGISLSVPHSTARSHSGIIPTQPSQQQPSTRTYTVHGPYEDESSPENTVHPIPRQHSTDGLATPLKTASNVPEDPSGTPAKPVPPHNQLVIDTQNIASPCFPENGAFDNIQSKHHAVRTGGESEYDDDTFQNIKNDSTVQAQTPIFIHPLLANNVLHEPAHANIGQSQHPSSYIQRGCICCSPLPLACVKVYSHHCDIPRLAEVLSSVTPYHQRPLPNTRSTIGLFSQSFNYLTTFHHNQRIAELHTPGEALYPFATKSPFPPHISSRYDKHVFIKDNTTNYVHYLDKIPLIDMDVVQQQHIVNLINNNLIKQQLIYQVNHNNEINFHKNRQEELVTASSNNNLIIDGHIESLMFADKSQYMINPLQFDENGNPIDNNMDLDELQAPQQPHLDEHGNEFEPFSLGQRTPMNLSLFLTKNGLLFSDQYLHYHETKNQYLTHIANSASFISNTNNAMMKSVPIGDDIALSIIDNLDTLEKYLQAIKLQQQKSLQEQSQDPSQTATNMAGGNHGPSGAHLPHVLPHKLYQQLCTPTVSSSSNVPSLVSTPDLTKSDSAPNSQLSTIPDNYQKTSLYVIPHRTNDVVSTFLLYWFTKIFTTPNNPLGLMVCTFVEQVKLQAKIINLNGVDMSLTSWNYLHTTTAATVEANTNPDNTTIFQQFINNNNMVNININQPNDSFSSSNNTPTHTRTHSRTDSQKTQLGGSPQPPQIQSHGIVQPLTELSIIPSVEFDATVFNVTTSGYIASCPHNQLSLDRGDSVQQDLAPVPLGDMYAPPASPEQTIPPDNIKKNDQHASPPLTKEQLQHEMLALKQFIDMIYILSKYLLLGQDVGSDTITPTSSIYNENASHNTNNPSNPKTVQQQFQESSPSNVKNLEIINNLLYTCIYTIIHDTLIEVIFILYKQCYHEFDESLLLSCTRQQHLSLQQLGVQPNFCPITTQLTFNALIPKPTPEQISYAVKQLAMNQLIQCEAQHLYQIIHSITLHYNQHSIRQMLLLLFQHQETKLLDQGDKLTSSSSMSELIGNGKNKQPLQITAQTYIHGLNHIMQTNNTEYILSMIPQVPHINKSAIVEAIVIYYNAKPYSLYSLLIQLHQAQKEYQYSQQNANLPLGGLSRPPSYITPSKSLGGIRNSLNNVHNSSGSILPLPPQNQLSQSNLIHAQPQLTRPLSRPTSTTSNSTRTAPQPLNEQSGASGSALSTLHTKPLEHLPFAKCILKLRQIPLLLTMETRAQALISILHTITTTIQSVHQSSSSQAALSTDDMLCVLTYIIIQAQVPCLYSVLLSINDMYSGNIKNQQPMLGESGFVLTTMISACVFIQQQQEQFQKEQQFGGPSSSLDLHDNNTHNGGGTGDDATTVAGTIDYTDYLSVLDTAPGGMTSGAPSVSGSSRGLSGIINHTAVSSKEKSQQQYASADDSLAVPTLYTSSSQGAPNIGSMINNRGGTLGIYPSGDDIVISSTDDSDLHLPSQNSSHQPLPQIVAGETKSSSCQ